MKIKCQKLNSYKFQNHSRSKFTVFGYMMRKLYTVQCVTYMFCEVTTLLESFVDTMKFQMLRQNYRIPPNLSSQGHRILFDEHMSPAVALIVKTTSEAWLPEKCKSQTNRQMERQSDPYMSHCAEQVKHNNFWVLFSWKRPVAETLKLSN